VHEAPVALHPAPGKITSNWFCENWFEPGLLKLNLTPAVAAAEPNTVTLDEALPALAFAANTGTADGTMNSIPENARSVRRSPELNFVTYAFEGVFIFYFQLAQPEELI
jgi:hypothetical protein